MILQENSETMTKTILVVDDKSSVRRLLEEYLSEQGYKVVGAANGREAIYSARHSQPDLILLDLMMPEMDGYQFLQQYRKEKSTPVIIITAREEETDAVLGLELGADDYVIKPFRLRELVARMRAVMRRLEPGNNLSNRLKAGGIEVNIDTHSVTINGKAVALTPIEFDLLSVLMRTPGKVFTRSELVERLEESGFSGLERTLNVHIRNLRGKIESEPENPRYIETVFGVGYRFCRDAT